MDGISGDVDRRYDAPMMHCYPIISMLWLHIYIYLIGWTYSEHCERLIFIHVYRNKLLFAIAYNSCGGWSFIPFHMWNMCSSSNKNEWKDTNETKKKKYAAKNQISARRNGAIARQNPPEACWATGLCIVVICIVTAMRNVVHVKPNKSAQKWKKTHTTQRNKIKCDAYLFPFCACACATPFSYFIFYDLLHWYFGCVVSTNLYVYSYLTIYF